jgi:hypothetical protein
MTAQELGSTIRSTSIDAERSGFAQCKECGIIWFGRDDITECPSGCRSRSTHVAVLCRACDVPVSVFEFAAHLESHNHLICVR